MKILEKGFSYKQRCEKCNALLLIEEEDIKRGSYTDYSGFTESYEVFYCPICKRENDIDYHCKLSYPNYEIGDGGLQRILELK